MAVVTDLANAAAAVSAGYSKIQTTNVEKGVTIYKTRFEKWLSGDNGMAGFLQSVQGQSTVDANTADTNALAALNAVRRHRYAGAPGQPSGATVVDMPKGKAPTVDTH